MDQRPLSFSQEALWFLCRLQPASPFYNMSRGYRLCGALERQALENAFADVVRRHAILRTRIVERDDRPELIVDPPQSRWTFETADVSGLPTAQRQAEVSRLNLELARRPFDLAHDLPVRARLTRLDETEHLLHVVFHHIVADRWSLDRVFAPELAERYADHLAGDAAPMPELPAQYWDFARRQREELTEEKRRSRLRYWWDSLIGAPAVLEVPGDRPRPPTRGFRGETYAFSLPDSLVKGAHELSRQGRTTMFMTMLTAFAGAVAQSSGTDDLIIGVPVMSRGRFDHPELIGMFVNTLPLRIDLRGGPPALAALKRVRSAVLGALGNGELPFEQIVAGLDIDRDLSRNPLIQVVFQFEDVPPGARFTEPEVFAEPVGVSSRSIRFDLELHMWLRADGGVSGKAAYATDLYDRDTIATLVSRIERVLGAMVVSPDQPLPGVAATRSRRPSDGSATSVHGSATSVPRVRRLDDRPDAAVTAPDSVARPLTPAERLVLDVWQEVLDVTGIRPGDNFFHVGGSSLRATRVAARLRQRLDLEVPLRLLFQHRTAEKLAAALPAAPKAAGGELTGISRPAMPPLSFGQERLWFLDQLVPSSTAYVMGTGFRLVGDLDPVVLRRALDELVRRHEVLRTSFPLDVSGRPWQSVASATSATPIALPVVQVAQATDEDITDTVVRLARKRVEEGLPLASGPLLRATLFRFTPRLHALVLHIHHSVCDAVSLNLIAREISALYTAFVQGVPPDLPEPPLQYADYATWQRQRAEGADAEREIAHWRRRLAGLTPLDLPTDRPRPAVQNLTGGRYSFSLPQDLTRAMARSGEDEDGTPYLVMLAAWAALLARYCDQDDVCVATPVDNRTRPELEQLVGFFADTVVMRIDFGGAPSFRELLHRVRDTFLEAHEHRNVPFERLVAELPVEQDASRNPLAQVALVLHDGRVPAIGLGPVRAEPFGLSNPATRFDLELHMRIEADRTRCLLTYAADLFDEKTVARMARHLVNLLGAAVADPERPVSRLELLEPEERHELLVTFNDTDIDLGGFAALHELVEEQVRRSPDAPAVVFGDRTLSYSALDAGADHLAAHLRDLGAGAERIVAVCLERSFDLVMVLLATLKSGAAFMPLSPDDPPGRLAALLGDASPAVLVTSESLRRRLPVVLPMDLPVVVVDAVRAEEPRPPAPRAPVEPRRMAYVLYTSGSTGKPNGAVNTHEGIVNRLRWMQAQFPLDAGDAVLQKTPVTFDVCVWEFFWPLISGARLVLAEPGGHRDPDYLARVIREQRITTVHFVPSMLHLFLARPGVEEATASLRRVLCSGEALDPGLQERCRRRIAADLYNLYGPAEAAVDVAFWRCRRGPRPDTVPIGRPIANTQLYVVDRHLQPVPAGVPGELCIGGVGVGRGYLGRDTLTELRFPPDPFRPGPGRRLFRTGDRARHRPDGALEFLGRRDDQVKLRGVRMELGEIEAALTAHPAVEAAAVALRADTPGGPQLVAYAVPEPRRAGVPRRLAGLDRTGRAVGQHRTVLPDGTPVFHRHGGETAFMYGEIFPARTYAPPGVRLPDRAVVFDVGANIGLFSLFAHRDCRDPLVYAFEPVPQVCDILRLNAELHGIDARVFDKALGDRPGTAEFTFYPGVSMLSGRYADSRLDRQRMRTIASKDLGPAASGRDVEDILDARLGVTRMIRPVITLSSVIEEQEIARIDLLKIDVERGELDVLAGITDGHWPLIRRIVIEVDDADGRLAAVLELLRSRGYTVAVDDSTGQAAADGLRVVHASHASREAAGSREPAGPRGTGGCDGPVADSGREDEADRLLGEEHGGPEERYISPDRLAGDLLAFLRHRLPLPMVPSSVVFLDELPLSPNGKTDRRRLPAPGDRPEQRGAVSPHDDTERALTELAEELLGVSPLGVTDDFFALGGHSILAAQLMARVETAFGRRPSLAAFLREPTVEQLAGSLRADRPPDPAPDGVVQLRAGTGDQPPLFLFAPLGGGVLCYRDLVRHLPPGPAVFGLRAPGLDEGTSPENDLARLAARQAAVVRRVWPTGPYRLAGWSFGGVVAFGVACELVREGLRVEPPVLIDSYPVAEPATAGHRAAEFVATFARERGLSAPPTPRRSAGTQDNDPLGWIISRLREIGVPPREIDDEEVARYWGVFDAAARAAERHRPTRFPGPLLLLRPRRPGRPQAGPAGGWGALADGGVEVRRVPGDHFTVLGAEAAAELSRILTS
ncbi:amino acid adenylation domain-containing protein [Streptomyces sp. NPDC020845]|uniref:amino acid adenylation domain-containing protein n=1 Tax=Streptomyces sp. NPDC020845 TaxID=3365096 RepID=UPI00378F225C